MFLGSFLSHTTSITPTPVDTGETSYVEIENGVFDDVYMDADDTLEFSTEIPEWGYTTLFHAKFQNNILAGNVDFTLDSISSLVIKRQKVGEYNWIKLYEKPIETADDFSFSLNDITVASQTSYNYAAIPIINDAEGTYQLTSIDVEFDGAFIVDPTYGYHLILNLSKTSLTRNNPSTLLEPVNSKYPYVNYYSALQYDTFSISGLFVALDRNTCEFDMNNGWSYRKEVRDFLTNRHSKIVKFYNGEIYLAAVTDQITESVDGHPDNVNTAINFTEVGDANDSSDLYYHGFVNYLEAGV